MPRIPVQAPLMEIPMSVITSVAAAFMMTPVVPAARIPARVPVPSRVIDLVIVTAPKPPGSSTEISPQAAVFEIAPAKVLHGAVRLHGLASSPTPDTHVREAWALMSEAPNRTVARTLNTFVVRILKFLTLIFGSALPPVVPVPWFLGEKQYL